MALGAQASITVNSCYSNILYEFWWDRRLTSKNESTWSMKHRRHKIYILGGNSCISTRLYVDLSSVLGAKQNTVFWKMVTFLWRIFYKTGAFLHLSRHWGPSDNRCRGKWHRWEPMHSTIRWKRKSEENQSQIRTNSLSSSFRMFSAAPLSMAFGCLKVLNSVTDEKACVS